MSNLTVRTLIVTLILVLLGCSSNPGKAVVTSSSIVLSGSEYVGTYYPGDASKSVFLTQIGCEFPSNSFLKPDWHKSSHKIQADGDEYAKYYEIYGCVEASYKDVKDHFRHEIVNDMGLTLLSEAELDGVTKNGTLFVVEYSNSPIVDFAHFKVIQCFDYPTVTVFKITLAEP